MSLSVPRGFRLAGVHCGVKKNPQKQDLTLIVSETPAVAVGVYTQNLVFAACVGLNRSRTPSERIRTVVINSGNANACTGERGDRDAVRMGELAAATCGAAADQALVLSTGVIGEFLPMEKIEAGIRAAATQLAAEETALVSAARGMLTTDTRHKLAGRTLELSIGRVQLTGMAKGAAMIGPRMATMLGVIMTDAPLAPAAAQEALSAAVDETFNCISVDGHMSTNDTVLLVANGAAAETAPAKPLAAADMAAFRQALLEVCTELAIAIPTDGEGATHLVTIEVNGCATRDAAHKIAKSVAESPLVKTAIAGADPNWGRIVSAAGYAGVPFDTNRVTLHLNGILVYGNGAPTNFDRFAVSRSIRDNRDTSVVLAFGEGNAKVRFWTTDLTAEYIRLNADYTT